MEKARLRVDSGELSPAGFTSLLCCLVPLSQYEIQEEHSKTECY